MFSAEQQETCFNFLHLIQLHFIYQTSSVAFLISSQCHVPQNTNIYFKKTMGYHRKQDISTIICMVKLCSMYTSCAGKLTTRSRPHPFYGCKASCPTSLTQRVINPRRLLLFVQHILLIRFVCSTHAHSLFCCFFLFCIHFSSFSRSHNNVFQSVLCLFGKTHV